MYNEDVIVIVFSTFTHIMHIHTGLFGSIYTLLLLLFHPIYIYAQY